MQVMETDTRSSLESEISAQYGGLIYSASGGDPADSIASIVQNLRPYLLPQLLPRRLSTTRTCNKFGNVTNHVLISTAATIVPLHEEQEDHEGGGAEGVPDEGMEEGGGRQQDGDGQDGEGSVPQGGLQAIHSASWR